MTEPNEPPPPPDPWERAPGRPASWERPAGQPAAWETRAWGTGPQQAGTGAPPPGYRPPGHGYGYPNPGYPPTYPAYPGYPPRPTAGKATTVMVLGIVGLATFFALCGVGVIPAIIALAMAPGARREIEASSGALEGTTQLRAGVIMAWVTVGLTVLAIAAIVVVVAVAESTSDGSGTLSSLAGAGRF